MSGQVEQKLDTTAAQFDLTEAFSSAPSASASERPLADEEIDTLTFDTKQLSAEEIRRLTGTIIKMKRDDEQKHVSERTLVDVSSFDGVVTVRMLRFPRLSWRPCTSQSKRDLISISDAASALSVIPSTAPTSEIQAAPPPALSAPAPEPAAERKTEEAASESALADVGIQTLNIDLKNLSHDDVRRTVGIIDQMRREDEKRPADERQLVSVSSLGGVLTVRMRECRSSINSTYLEDPIPTAEARGGERSGPGLFGGVPLSMGTDLSSAHAPQPMPQSFSMPRSFSLSESGTMIAPQAGGLIYTVTSASGFDVIDPPPAPPPPVVTSGDTLSLQRGQTIALPPTRLAPAPHPEPVTDVHDAPPEMLEFANFNSF